MQSEGSLHTGKVLIIDSVHYTVGIKSNYCKTNKAF